MTDWAGRQTSHVYDLAGHLASVSRPNNTLRVMAYDDDGELTNIVEQTTTHFPICFNTLNYNPAGRVQWEFKGPLPHTNTPSTRTMTFDSDNRLKTFNGPSVTVDNDGNLTYGPGTNNTFGTYTYDTRNELTSAGGVTCAYDPAGNRTSMTNGSAVTAYMADPKTSQVLMRFKTVPSSNYVSYITSYYIYGNGLLYEIDVTLNTDGEIVNGQVECPCEVLSWATNTAYYHFDCRGSTVALTDGNGNPTDLIEYSPYGMTTFRYGTNDTPFRYNGRYGVQTDPNGLLYMRARYYNPNISRFINADPSGFAGGLNFYAFCNGNPISLTDPFGLGADQPWQNQLGSWVSGQVQTAQSFYNQYLPWEVAGVLNTGISIVGGVGQVPQAVGNVGTGSGTFSANPTLANSAGVFSDISVVASTLIPVAGIVDNSLATSAAQGTTGTVTTQDTAAALLNGPNGAVYQQVTRLADAMQSGNAQAVYDQLSTLSQTQAGRQQLLQIHLAVSDLIPMAQNGAPASTLINLQEVTGALARGGH